jgi:tRNA-specific 2-thiouridylase
MLFDDMERKKRVVVAMSGGVDSSVAAYLLKEQGYDVLGVTMRLWSDDNAMASKHNKQCCSIEDIQDAKRVAQILDIPHYVLNFEKEFQTHVMDYFVQEYKQGRTPHPCIACNDKIKFAFFLQRAMTLEADWIATGHYARRYESSDGIELRKALDESKDQTYVLYGLTQEELSHALFPVGEIKKEDIRQIAKDLKLPVADKPDSQEICFVPSGDYRTFLAERIEFKNGPILDLDGNELGTHSGSAGYTIGQRKGLPASRTGKPQYVVSINAEENTIIVGNADDLFAIGLEASNINFMASEKPDFLKLHNITAKIRYQSQEVPISSIRMVGDDKLEIIFESPQRAVTPGQTIAIYNGDILIGGGRIDKALSEIKGKHQMMSGGK